MTELEQKKKSKGGEFALCSDCQARNYLEFCDECQRVLCLRCLGLYHGSEYLFCQNCFDKKSDKEKEIMKGIKKGKIILRRLKGEMSKRHDKN